MTNQEILEFYNKMVEFYGPALPHPDHQPIQFAYLVKLYKYHQGLNDTIIINTGANLWVTEGKGLHHDR